MKSRMHWATNLVTLQKNKPMFITWVFAKASRRP
jgi:hypothetical protein